MINRRIFKYIYVIYRAGGPYGKNCARGLAAEGRTQDLGHSFFPYGTPAR